MLLFIIVVSLATFALLPTVVILPTLQAYYNTRHTWDTHCLQMLSSTTLLIEAFAHHLLKNYILIDVYAYIRNIIAYGMIAIGTFGFICGFLRSVYSCNCSCAEITKVFIFAYTLLAVILIAIYSFPILIEAFIYPTEVITTIAFIVIGIASTVTAYTLLKWFISKNFNSKKKKNTKRKCCYCLQMLAIIVCTYIVVPVSVYLLLFFYSTLLKFRSESPSSQLIQILLSFVPPFLAGLGTFMVRKRLGGQHIIRVNKNKDDDNKPKQKDQSTSTPTNQPSDSADDQEEEQTENEREEAEIQQQRRVSINSSQEIQATVVEVDVHQENAPNDYETTV